MAFEIDELTIKRYTDSELIRVSEILNVLKKKAINQEKLTEHEKNFFCSHLKVFCPGDNMYENNSCCKNFIFKKLYLTYCYDITGGSSYYKVAKFNEYKVKASEVQEDLENLYNISKEWDVIVQKTNHKEELLQQLTAEVRKEDLKILNDSQVPRGSFMYRFKKIAILLQSKFIYCIALEIFETFRKDDFILELNSTQIEINEYSLIHILNRHFAEAVKQHNSSKSFHNENFKPRLLNIQLKEIFQNIDTSKLLLGKSIDKIAFQHDGIDYLLYTHEREKTVKGGKGNVVYRRLETFFPISDITEKSKLVLISNLVKINESLSIYVPK